MSAQATGGELSTADIVRIMEMLPHRYPFLLVDRIVELERGECGAGIKNVTINEPFFQGHFPGHPIMPGGADHRGHGPDRRRCCCSISAGPRRHSWSTSWPSTRRASAGR